MSKKQSFGDKVGGKKGASKNHIKLIRMDRSVKSGALRFYDEMIRIPDGKNADSVVKEILAKEA